MQEKITEAFDRYAEFCESNNFIYQQPTLEDTTVTEKQVILRNLNGVLARYDIEKDEIVV